MSKPLSLVVSMLLAFSGLHGASPPPQAVSAGFSTLAFDEEFSSPLDIGFGTDGHKWNAGLWWEQIPSDCCFSLENGVLTINAENAADVNLCTQFHDHSGGTNFQGGYFEAHMWCTDWSAFWLFCWDRPTVFGSLVLPGSPLTWTNEIDIIETDPSTPTTAYCTLHSNSSGDGGVPDQINQPNHFASGHQLIRGWHTYGLLWTRAGVSWYVDNVRIASAPAFPSTWQPVQLILTAAPGGVNQGSNGTLGVSYPPLTQVHWVRVWQK